MSHFTVLVASRTGQNLEEQLAPFDEDRRVEFIEDDEFDEDERAGGRRGYWHNDRARWDWWVIGGRWSGRLLTRDGRMVDSARKGDLDLDGMYRQGRARAADQLRQYEEIVAAHGPIPSRDWTKLDPSTDEFKLAREAFWKHPAVERVMGYSSDSLHLGWDDLDMIEQSPSGWVEAEATSGVVCFALLTHDGRWLEQGEMGWFGVSDTTAQSRAGYLEVARAYLDSVDDDTVLTVCDCHI